MYKSNYIRQPNNNTYQTFLKKSSNKYINHIMIPQEELNDIISSLELIINNITQDQNQYYIIEGLEKIINKLKNYYINFKHKSNFNKDIKKKIFLKEFSKENSANISNIEFAQNQSPKDNYSPLKPSINNRHQYNKSINYLNITNNLNDTSHLAKAIKINKSSSNIKVNLNKSYNSYTIKSPIRNGRSPKETRYNGPRVNGKKEGKGIYLYPNGSRYEGYFKNDKKEGPGIFYYINGDRYEGQFKNGNYHGDGIFYFSNGDKYEGQFENNKYSGKGKYFYHNGDWFDGFWMDDKKNGDGTYYYQNGDRTVGQYYNGKPYGTHIRYCQDGRAFKITY